MRSMLQRGGWAAGWACRLALLLLGGLPRACRAVGSPLTRVHIAGMSCWVVGSHGAKTSVASWGGVHSPPPCFPALAATVLNYRGVADLQHAVLGDGVEWRSSSLAPRGSRELCCGHPCKNCTHPQAFSTRAITRDSSARGVQFRCDGSCVVGLTTKIDNLAVTQMEFAVQIDGAASPETCTVKVIHVLVIVH